MSDRVRDAFEALIEQMEEPPTWEDLTAPDTVFIARVGGEETPGQAAQRGWLAAAVAAALVGLLALVPLLNPASAGTIVDEVLAESEGPARLAVGFDASGELCAQAGSATQSELVCGEDGLAAVGFQAYTDLAVAGFAPASAVDVTVLYADGRRRSVDLVPVPGRDTLAFGSIIRVARPGAVQIAIADDRGVVTDRQWIPVGSAADALGWETVPFPEEVEPVPMGAVLVGSELVFGDGHAYTPDAGTWRDHDPFRETSDAPFRLDPPSPSVWTGDVLLVASEGAGVASYDPDSDSWDLLAEPPDGIGFGPFFEIAWTGSELIVWTTNEIGIALDPATGAWRTLPRPPDRFIATFTHNDMVYTGRELIVWGQSSPSMLRPEPRTVAGAILELETGEWAELPEPIADPDLCECILRGGQTIVWTGESLLISTSHLSSAPDTSEPVLIAYHPDTNRWTYEGVSPLGWDPSSFNNRGRRAFVAGDRIVLMSDDHLYLSPPGWQPQGEAIPADGLYSVEQR